VTRLPTALPHPARLRLGKEELLLETSGFFIHLICKDDIEEYKSSARINSRNAHRPPAGRYGWRVRMALWTDARGEPRGKQPSGL